MFMATKLKHWTLEELHRLPDDGNKYELVRGELFVTPAPTPDHETVASRLHRALEAYVADNGLGMVYRPRAVLRFEGSEVEPDLMVRAEIPRGVKWEDAPTPILIVEVLSASTWRRDHNQKRSLYMDAGVAEYWIVDLENSAITSIRAGYADVVAKEELVWSPPDASASLTIDVRRVFD